MFRVITIAREFGSGGATIARLLAGRLGWRLLDRDLINELALAANVDPRVVEQLDERCDPWFRGLVKAIWRGSAEAPTGMTEADVPDAATMVKVGRQVIEAAARGGNCVIVGRGSQCILYGWPDVFKVYLYAPIELRRKRIAERFGPRPDLEMLIRENDHNRASYIRRYFTQEWCNPHLYDLMINSRCGDEAVVETVLCATGLNAKVGA